MNRVAFFIKNFLYSLVFCMVFSQASLACQCPDNVSAVDLSACGKYDVIFKGEVKDVSECADGEQHITFEIDRLYKGEAERSSVVIMQCNDACIVPLHDGDVCLMFLNKNNAQNLLYEACTYSRKQAAEGQVDYEEEVRGTAFLEDELFLEQQFEANKYYQQGLKPRKYEKVDPALIPIFLGVSLVFMVVGYFLFNFLSKRKSS